jgi:hypothetical protein
MFDAKNVFFYVQLVIYWFSCAKELYELYLALKAEFTSQPDLPFGSSVGRSLYLLKETFEYIAAGFKRVSSFELNMREQPWWPTKQ